MVEPLDCFLYFETNRGDVVKTVAEMLKNTLAGQCFCTLSAQGIRFCNQDAHRTIVSSQILEASKFFKYVFRGKEDYTFGLNTQNLYRMIKAAKKKQVMSGYIVTADDKKFIFIINDVTTSILIQRNQPVLPEIPTGYEAIPCVASSSTYQSLCKEMTLANSKYIKVTSCRDGRMRFEIDNKAYSKGATIGTRIQLHRDKSWPEFSQTFTLKTFLRLQKIAVLSNIIRFKWKPHLPLYIGYSIEPLGEGEIYIESDELSQSKTVVKTEEHGEASDFELD